MVQPAPNWPDITQMLQQLQTSGVLTAHATPIGPIQPLPHPPELKHPQHLQNLVGVTTTDHPTVEIKAKITDNPLFHKLTKLLGVALTFEGMFGIFRSLQFLFVEYPALEIELATHQIPLEEVNHIAGKVIIEVLSTIMGLLFALKLTLLHTRALHIIHIILGLFFFVLNGLLMMGLLDQFNFITPLTSGIFSLIRL